MLVYQTIRNLDSDVSLVARVETKDQELIKFDTYRFYLECIADYINHEYGDLHQFGIRCLENTRKLRLFNGFDSAWVERFLKIAWNTEYLLSISTGKPELMRISNQWIPIQTYYAVYAACEATGYVLDGGKSGSHQKALRKMTEHFVKVGLSPWNKAYYGAGGRLRNEHRPVNFPSELEIPHNLQRIDVNPLGMIARCLRAEHSNRIDEQWHSKKKSGAYKYKYNPGHTGILHFLYRLRIKCNYESVDPFISEAPDSDIVSFSNSLLDICFSTLFYLETHLIRRCHKNFLLDIGHQYLTLNSKAERLEWRLKFFEENA